MGSNTSLVAPVRVGRGAIVAAGSTVTEEVPADGIAFGRAQQVNKPGRAAAWRGKARAAKAASEAAKASAGPAKSEQEEE